MKLKSYSVISYLSNNKMCPKYEGYVLRFLRKQWGFLFFFKMFNLSCLFTAIDNALKDYTHEDNKHFSRNKIHRRFFCMFNCLPGFK